MEIGRFFNMGGIGLPITNALHGTHLSVKPFSATSSRSRHHLCYVIENTNSGPFNNERGLVVD